MRALHPIIKPSVSGMGLCVVKLAATPTYIHVINITQHINVTAVWLGFVNLTKCCDKHSRMWHANIRNVFPVDVQST